jgi:hypothetical protein
MLPSDDTSFLKISYVKLTPYKTNQRTVIFGDASRSEAEVLQFGRKYSSKMRLVLQDKNASLRLKKGNP